MGPRGLYGGSPVLIIEDNEITADITAAALRAVGVKDVEVAGNGIEALKLLDQLGEDLALIVCDLHMPEMNGVEFLRVLADQKCGVPIVLMSGDESPLLESTERFGVAFGLNIAGAVSKPLDKEKLAEITAHAVTAEQL